MPEGNFGYDLHRNQVFAKEDFSRVVSALQAAQATGRGAVATTRLTTVANIWHGVEAGITTDVTWVYLSRASVWENLLHPDVAKVVVPPGAKAADPSQSIEEGPLKHFPYYDDVTESHLTPAQVNLLVDLQGWIVKANDDLFRAALE